MNQNLAATAPKKRSAINAGLEPARKSPAKGKARAVLPSPGEDSAIQDDLDLELDMDEQDQAMLREFEAQESVRPHLLL